MIFVVDDDEMMAECVALATKKETKIFSNAYAAMAEIADGNLPEMIFLDILLTGPDGFTFLNELVSYDDTARIPIVVVTSLNLEGRDLSVYGVVGVLEKDKMTPSEVREYVEKYVG